MAEPKPNKISLDGLDDETVKEEKVKKPLNMYAPVGMMIKLFLFIFAAFMAVCSDSFLRVMGQSKNMVDDGRPTIKGMMVQGVVLSSLAVILYALLTHSVI